MLISVNGKVGKICGNSASITNDRDIILTINVIGTCFPARESETQITYLRISGQNNVENKVYIDYADGTGEHEYQFKASGANRAIYFTNRANLSDPNTIAGTTTYDVKPATEPPFGIHFFQDLPDNVINTVNNSYPMERTISIRFEKPQAVVSLEFFRILMNGVFPSAISKFRNLNTFAVSYSRNISNFLADFYTTNIKVLILSFFGVSLDNGFPNWILNSPLERLDLSDSINLLDNPDDKKFSQINRLKNTLKILELRNTQINYRLPHEFNELSLLQSLSLQTSNSPDLRFPINISGLLSLNDITLRATRMPFTEIERIINELPGSNISLNIMDCDYVENYDIANNNYSVTNINIGYQRWENNTPPVFINKLKSLRSLSLQGSTNFPLIKLFTNYGDFRQCTEIITITVINQVFFTTEVPAWLNQLKKLKVLRMGSTYNTLARVNAFVNNVYQFVVLNAQMTGAISDFRDMLIDVNSTDPIYAARPSGIYQAPAGYAQGVNNGAPATPMEKIWVLTNQYNHLWIIKPQ